MDEPKAMKEMAERLRRFSNLSDSKGPLLKDAADMLEAAAATLQTPVDSDVREALKLAADVLSDMISCGHIISMGSDGPGYPMGEGVMPKIAAALAQEDKVKP